jgi:hypothetical protein
MDNRLTRLTGNSIVSFFKKWIQMAPNKTNHENIPENHFHVYIHAKK